MQHCLYSQSNNDNYIILLKYLKKINVLLILEWQSVLFLNRHLKSVPFVWLTFEQHTQEFWSESQLTVTVYVCFPESTRNTQFLPLHSELWSFNLSSSVDMVHVKVIHIFNLSLIIFHHLRKRALIQTMFKQVLYNSYCKTTSSYRNQGQL